MGAAAGVRGLSREPSRRDGLNTSVAEGGGEMARVLGGGHQGALCQRRLKGAGDGAREVRRRGADSR